MHAITVENVTKRFGEVNAVSDLSFVGQPGRVTAFLGPNGSGKTTTIRMILGLSEPTSGTAQIGGIPYRQLEKPLHTIGAALDGGFHPGRRAQDHLKVLARAIGVGSDRIDAVLEQVGLSDARRRRVGGFSTGMRQRLSLAAALLADPPVLILDEPLNGLDPEGIHWVRALTRSLADEGRTVLLSSHVLSETEQIADDVVIISHGQLRSAGPLRDLEDRLTPRVLVRTPQPEAAEASLRSAELVFQNQGDGFVVDATSDRVGDLFGAAGIVLHELSPRRQRLEEVYFEMVGINPLPPPPITSAPNMTPTDSPQPGPEVGQ